MNTMFLQHYKYPNWKKSLTFCQSCSSHTSCRRASLSTFSVSHRNTWSLSHPLLLTHYLAFLHLSHTLTHTQLHKHAHSIQGTLNNWQLNILIRCLLLACQRCLGTGPSSKSVSLTLGRGTLVQRMRAEEGQREGTLGHRDSRKERQKEKREGGRGTEEEKEQEREKNLEGGVSEREREE